MLDFNYHHTDTNDTKLIKLIDFIMRSDETTINTHSVEILSAALELDESVYYITMDYINKDIGFSSLSQMLKQIKHDIIQYA